MEEVCTRKQGRLIVQIQCWIRSNVEVEISDEEIYTTSLKVEPRNPSEAIENMLMEEQKMKELLMKLQLRVSDLEVSFNVLS